MRVHLVLIAIIGLLLLGGICSAAYIPDQTSSISSSAGNWVVVNHQSDIVITASNNTYGPISGATVSVTLNSTTLGTLSAGSTTDASGQVTGTFTAGTHPGTVIITATITYVDAGTTYTVTKTYIQNIDHDIAKSAVFDYKKEVTVNTETPFNITFTDKYGNPIDNRNPADPHSLTLSIGSIKGNAAFDINGKFIKDTTLPLDSQGKFSVIVLTDIAGGENIININSFGSIVFLPQSIVGITDGKPYSITQTVTPDNPASYPADGAPDHKFTFIYILNDQFGNTAKNQSVLVHTNWAGDSDITLTSNDDGLASFNYGPHSASGNITITATTLSNASVSAVKEIQYYNTAPVSMVLTASPQIMPSLDAKPGQATELVAKVTDIMGNPVTGQTVTFSMGTPVYDYANCVTGGPKLLNTTAVTDDNGNAIAIFIPGSFDTNKANVTFDATDTGRVSVIATWTTVQQPIELSWKNYPYLNVKTVISPPHVGVNGTFDVTITLKGDGWNLTGKPADIVIVTDLAGGIGGPELLAQTKPAEKAFVNSATNDTYISLVSFGNAPATSGTKYASDDTISLWNLQKANKSLTLFNPYGNVWDYNYVDTSHWNSIVASKKYCFTPAAGSGQDCTRAVGPSSISWMNPYSDAKKEVGLLNAGSAYPANRNILTNKINSYVSAGGTDYAAGINAAIKELNENGNPTHNQTIIIMGDGINMMAPISPGSLESYWPSDWAPVSALSYFDESEIGKAAAVDSANRAKSQKMTIYAIGFSTPDSNKVLRNDFAFFKPLASSSGTFYDESDDPGFLKLSSIFLDILGKVQNTAAVNATVGLNFQNVNITLNNISSMTPGGQVFDYVYDPSASTIITDQNGITYTIDQTAEWNNHKTLTFNVGTITVGQTWSTTFRLKVKQPGEIDIFGDQSSINFNTGESMGIPKTWGGGSYNFTNNGSQTTAIQISDLHVTQTTITDFVPLTWNITYPGNSAAAQQRIYYSNDDMNSWVLAHSQAISPGTSTETYNLDARDLPTGTYYIEVVATAPDVTYGDKQVLPAGIEIGTAGKAYIKLE